MSRCRLSPLSGRAAHKRRGARLRHQYQRLCGVPRRLGRPATKGGLTHCRPPQQLLAARCRAAFVPVPTLIARCCSQGRLLSPHAPPRRRRPAPSAAPGTPGPPAPAPAWLHARRPTLCGTTRASAHPLILLAKSGKGWRVPNKRPSRPVSRCRLSPSSRRRAHR